MLTIIKRAEKRLCRLCALREVNVLTLTGMEELKNVVTNTPGILNTNKKPGMVHF